MSGVSHPYINDQPVSDGNPMPSSDPLAIGWVDDGHESGAIRTRRADADLVRYPLRDSQYRAEVQGTATATFTRESLTGNPTGLGYQLALSVPNDGASGARIWVPFHGRAFGILWHSIQTTPDFSVAVDGETVRVPGWMPDLVDAGITTQIVDAEAAMLTHDNLDRGRHLAEIVLTSLSSGTIALNLYGLLLDRGAGYTEPPRPQHFVRVPDLPNTATAISLTSSAGAGERTMRGVRKIIYYNKSGGAITVTIENNSVAYWLVSIPAGETREFDLGGVTALSNASGGWTHKASAATSINALIVEGY